MCILTRIFSFYRIMRSDELSDEELITGCRQNNRMSQELLYRRYVNALFGFCLMYENNREKARDILQEAFIKIFTNIKSLENAGSLNCWMKKIVSNTAIDYYRKTSNELRFIPIDDAAQEASDKEPFDAELSSNDILSQVNKLPKGAKLIFQLHEIEGYSHKEIAELLHISIGTSKSQINRARQLLQHWMGENRL